jgi:hypothetical protein
MATAALTVTNDGNTNRNELRQLGNSLIQLSDGTPVWLEYSGGSYLTMKAWPAHGAAAVTIANKLSGSGRPVGGIGATYDGTVLALCRDAADNLYVIGRSSGSDVTLHASAWVKGEGYTWTERTNQTAIRTTASIDIDYVTATWANTGGGLDGAGHIVLVYAMDAARYAVLDAGKLLLGLTGIVTSGAAFSGLEPTGNADISSDGFGATNGLVAVASYANSNRITISSWSVNAAGALTTATLTAPPLSDDVADESRVRVVRYAPDRWALVYCDWFTSDYFRIRRYSSTGPIGASVASDVPVNMPGTLGALPNATWSWLWDAQASPVEPNVVRVFGQHPTTSNVWSLKADLTSGVAWDTTALPEPHTYGGSSPRGGLRAVKEPLETSFGDFQVYVHRTSVPDYRLISDFHSYAAAPATPTLSSPANASSMDVEVGVTFTWTYNPSETSGMQDAWALRIKPVGGSYTYWNATTGTWDASIAWNVGTATNVAIPFGLTNGHDYDWSVATREDVSGITGPFAADARLLARATPAVSVLAPEGVLTATATPTVEWAGALAPTTGQISYRVVVESGSPDVTPGAGVTAWDSGTVASASPFVVVPAHVLTNGVAYRVFVQVAQTGGQLSGWSFTDVALQLSAPAQPTVETFVDTSEARVAVVVTASDNLLSADASDAEDGLALWQLTRAGALLRSTDTVIQGSASYELHTTLESAGSTAEATMGAGAVSGDGIVTLTDYDMTFIDNGDGTVTVTA